MSETIRISNIKNYTQEIINDELILTPKKIIITENEINMTNLAHSSIMECIIKKGEENISTKKSYRAILIDIWKSMSTQKLFQNTTFNTKLGVDMKGVKGYNWHNDIKMSFQNKDAKGTLKEIIKMVKVSNNMSINLSVKLETGRIINFKIE